MLVKMLPIKGIVSIQSVMIDTVNPDIDDKKRNIVTIQIFCEDVALRIKRNVAQ